MGLLFYLYLTALVVLLGAEVNATIFFRNESGKQDRQGVKQEKRHSNRKMKEKRTMQQITKVRVLLGVLAMLVLVGSVTGCGLVSDQTKQQAKKKVESKAQQAKQEVRRRSNQSQG